MRKRAKRRRGDPYPGASARERSASDAENPTEKRGKRKYRIVRDVVSKRAAKKGRKKKGEN